jgi:hypothetical protein
MISTLFSFERGARRLSTLAVAGAVLLSACEADRSIAPNRAMPDSVSLALAPNTTQPGTLVISVVDWAKNPVKYTGAFFLLSAPGMSDLEVRDNTVPDVDLAIGTLRVKKLVAGTYTVCQQAPAEHYVTIYPPCKTVTVFGGGKATQVEFVNLQTARMAWRVIDKWDNPVGGVMFKGTDANAKITVITDDGAGDLDDRQGYVEIDAVPGTYELCQTAIPASHVFPAGQTFSCVTRQMADGSVQMVPDTRLNPLYSIHWRLKLDGLVDYPIGAGYTSFEVKSLTNGGFSKIVHDNGAEDWDGTRAGEFATVLPAAGAYIVCQLNAPNGFQLSSPPCKRVSVGLGEPALVGWFFNLEI